MSEKQCCKAPDIGGQAVMEGVMMRSPDSMAISVRRPDGTIVSKLKPVESPAKKHPWMGKPVIRGVVNFVNMLTSGMAVLEESTQMLGIMDEEPTKFEKWLAQKLGKGVDKIVMGVAIVLAVILSVGLFIALPSALETWLKAIGVSPVGYTLLGGLLKILILIAYMVFCGAVPDVRRTFMYHGAEHKTVYCHEANLPLTPENAQRYSTLHPRCGTAFLLIVFIVGMLLFLVLNVLLPISNYFLRLLFHLAMLPIVAGVSYEVLKGLAHSNSAMAKFLRWPGLQMQRLTTRRPDDDMLEVAIVSMNLVIFGIPEDCETTSEGYTVIRDYRVTDPAMRAEIEKEQVQ